MPIFGKLCRNRFFVTGACFAALLLISFIGYREWHHNYYEALTVTGATPLALQGEVPRRFKINVGGEVKKPYSFGSSALRAFATTRVRTKEVAPDGSFGGNFIYLGIPVFNILEGVAPAYPRGGDHPEDFLVTFESRDGGRVRFCWGELMLAGDAWPVTLAYSRLPMITPYDKLKPDYKPPEEMLSGFRLIAPRDPDTERYLDDVVRVTFGQVRLPIGTLPERKKGMKCESRDLFCIEGDRSREAVWEGLERVTFRNWPRVYHGKGFVGQETASGYLLRDFLVRNFEQITPKDYFLIVSCDGYRVLCSAREIFQTDSGKGVLIVEEITGRRPPGWRMLAWTADYYADRESWGIRHIVRFRMPWDDPQSQAVMAEGL